MDLSTGTLVSDRYAIEAQIGEGGMAVVYRARHVTLGTLHALKVLTMTGRSIRERLVQEGRVQAQLRHPNIVAVTDVVEVNGAPALVMELVDGPSLDELVKLQKLTLEQAEVIGRGILAGVAHAHAFGLVHRDLKPANVMLQIIDGGVIPKVTDFGLAKIVAGDDTSRAQTRTGATMGTPQYMSPEQIKNAKSVDARSDVFACGGILYELLTGQRAFDGENLLEIFAAVSNGTYPDSRGLRPEAPERLHAAIDGALKSDREQRTPSAAALYQAWAGHPLPAGSMAPASIASSFSPDQLAKVAGARSVASGSVASSRASRSGETLAFAPEPMTLPATSGGPRSLAPTLVVGGGLAAAGVAAAAVVALLLVIGLGWWFWPAPSAPMIVERTVFVQDPNNPEGPPVAVVEQVPVDAPTPTPVPTVAPVPTVTPGPKLPDGVPWNELPEDARDAVVVVTEPEPVTPEPVTPEPVTPEPGPPTPAPTPEPASGGFTADDLPASLRHSDYKLRIAAINQTWESDASPEGTTYLTWMIDNDDQMDVRRRAFQALMVRWEGQRSQAAVCDRYARAAMGRSDATMRMRAIRAWSARGGSLQPLEALLAHADDSTRKAAVDATVAVGTRLGLKSEAHRMLTARVASEQVKRVQTALDEGLASLL